MLTKDLVMKFVTIPSKSYYYDSQAYRKLSIIEPGLVFDFMLLERISRKLFMVNYCKVFNQSTCFR